MFRRKTNGRQLRRASLAGSYTQKVLLTAPSNLIAYWPLNEISGTTADNLEGTAARDGTYTGVTLNATSFYGMPAGQWDATNDIADMYSASLGTAFVGAEGSLAGWIKVRASTVWTDATLRIIATFWGGTGSNYVTISKATVNNRLTFAYNANTTVETINSNSNTSTDWIHVAMTWSLAADTVAAYVNGTSAGTSNTLGTWSASTLLSTFCNLGAQNTAAPVNVWDGYLSNVAIWTTPLTATQVAFLATV